MSEDVLADLKKAVKTPKLVLGTRSSLAAMKEGNVAKLYVAKNAPATLKEDVAHFSKLSGTQVIDLDVESDEFGIICKRQHNVSVAAVLK